MSIVNEFYESIGVKFIRNEGPNECVYECPDCHTNHLYVNKTNGLWICFKGCGEGNAFQLAKKVTTLDTNEIIKLMAKYGMANEIKPTKKKKEYPLVNKDTLKKFFHIKGIAGEPDFLTKEDVRIKGNTELQFLGYKSAKDTIYTSRVRASVDGTIIRLKDGSTVKYPTCGPASLLGIKAVANKNIVVICEGLKDWLTARSLDLDAVTGTNGCGTFKSEWVSNFKDKIAYIIYDRDEPGINGARKVAGLLNGTAKEVYIVELPYEVKPEHGDDLTDYISRDKHTLQDLQKLMNDAKLFEPTPEELEKLQKSKSTYPYIFNDEGTFRSRDDGKEKLANFKGQITRSALHDDGVSSERFFTVELSTANKKRKTEIPASKFGDMRWLPDVSHDLIIQPGSNVKDHLRTAIQMNSLGAIEETIYAHTGWREINSQAAYLTGNGAIGENGWIPSISVSLPTGLAYSLSLPEKDDIKKCIYASLELLKVADITVTLPLFCSIGRVPIGKVDYSDFIVGPTGCGKTVIATLYQQHFGKQMINPAANWSCTANALEVMSFITKDTMFLIDDFASQIYNDKAERIFRAQGNNSARQRLNADSILKDAKPPRSLIAATGEDLPSIRSILARIQVIEMAAEQIDWDRVTEAQIAGSMGLYEQAMGGYVRWLAPNIFNLQKSLTSEVHSILSDFSSHGFSHKRTGMIAANQLLGLITFCEYALDVKAITSSEHDNLIKLLPPERR